MILAGKKAAYITLGCKLNFSETSTIRHSLENAGVTTVDEKQGADIFIINTCSVTDVAERKGRQIIRKIIHHNPDAYIVVVGCYAQLRAKELMQIEGVNLVLGAQDKFKVEEYLRFCDERQKQEPHSCDIFKLGDSISHALSVTGHGVSSKYRMAAITFAATVPSHLPGAKAEAPPSARLSTQPGR